jgi:hypothetical protein
MTERVFNFSRDPIMQRLMKGNLAWGNVSLEERKMMAADEAASSPYVSSARGSSNTHKGSRKTRNAYFKTRGIREAHKERKRRRRFTRINPYGRMSEFNRQEAVRKTRKAAEREERRVKK